MHHIMLDLETLGTSAGARILTIGACRFDPFTGKIGDTFHTAVDDNGIVDNSTFAWWLGQGGMAQNKLLAMIEDAKPPGAAIAAFSTFCYNDQPAKFLWSNGPSFDEAILREFFHRHGNSILWPMSYWGSRCVRTISAAAGPNLTRVEPTTSHDALADAIAQAKTVAESYRILRITPDRE